MTLFGESDAVSGELLSTKCPVLMKMFLLGMNKRRNSNFSKDILGGRLVHEYLNVAYHFIDFTLWTGAPWL